MARSGKTLQLPQVSSVKQRSRSAERTYDQPTVTWQPGLPRPVRPGGDSSAAPNHPKQHEPGFRAESISKAVEAFVDQVQEKCLVEQLCKALQDVKEILGIAAPNSARGARGGGGGGLLLPGIGGGAGGGGGAASGEPTFAELVASMRKQQATQYMRLEEHMRSIDRTLAEQRSELREIVKIERRKTTASVGANMAHLMSTDEDFRRIAHMRRPTEKAPILERELNAALEAWDAKSVHNVDHTHTLSNGDSSEGVSGNFFLPPGMQTPRAMRFYSSEAGGTPMSKCKSTPLAPMIPVDLRSEVHTPRTDMLKAILLHNLGDIQLEVMLDEGANPNEELGELLFTHKHFLKTTPLTVAALVNKIDCVDLLLEQKADISSNISFVMGALQVEWSGEAVFAAALGGHVHVMETLLCASADADSKSSNKATPLWMAAYYGKLEVVDRLLLWGVDMDALAESPDEESVTHSAVHVAARAGFHDVVNLLVKQQADIIRRDELVKAPLDDALESRHARVVRLLVASKGELLGSRDRQSAAQMAENASLADQPLPGWRRRVNLLRQSSRNFNSTFPTLERLLKCGNSVVIDAAADGLRFCPEQLELLDKDILLRFLQTPGKAPATIMESVFRPVVLRYWNKQEQRAETVQTAFLRKRYSPHHRDMLTLNATEGPSPAKIAALGDSMIAPSQEMLKFINTLAPQQPQTRWHDFMPVDIEVCPVPGLCSLEVLLALDNTSCKEVWSLPACQAIVQLTWSTEWRTHTCGLALDLLDTLNFWGISILIHPKNVDNLNVTNGRDAILFDIMLTIAVVRWALMVAHRLFMYLGLRSKGLFWHYYMDINNMLTIGNLVSTGTILGAMVVDIDTVAGSLHWRVALACVAFIRWMVLLYKVRAYDDLGLKALPIMQAMWAVGPFFFVVVFYLLGTAHAYYTLGVSTGFNSLLLSFRLGLLGEVDVSDLAGPHAGEGDTASKHDYVMGALMAFVTFTLTLTLLNIYIGILSLSYERAYPTSWHTLMAVRVNIIVRHKAFRVGWRVLFSMLKIRRAQAAGERKRMISSHVWMARVPVQEGLSVGPPSVGDGPAWHPPEMLNRVGTNFVAASAPVRRRARTAVVSMDPDA